MPRLIFDLGGPAYTEGFRMQSEHLFHDHPTLNFVFFLDREGGAYLLLPEGTTKVHQFGNKNAWLLELPTGKTVSCDENMLMETP